MSKLIPTDISKTLDADNGALKFGFISCLRSSAAS